MMASTTPWTETNAIPRLVEVIAQLRERCPWVADQTPGSLVGYLIEESYELVEALETGQGDQAGLDELRGELGDVLLQVVLHARIQQERGNFDLDAVARTLTEKMIRRNPHVFTPDGSLVEGAAEIGVDDIEKTWQNVKRQEKPARSSPLDGIPAHLPALIMAAKVSARVHGHGSVDREGHAREHELGDMLLNLVEETTRGGLDAERALRAAIRRRYGT
ncbi:MazG nucleotide pyrophosphohydrolase domain-containing protein [Arthrobacter roseus]|uniref:MazG nucleotide pyrophosphohydrolase domain-containing protein n=1 Tax=Arthrobacter roseus TaxID=136274 RepID=UPI001EF8AAEB|nr:MazG nucleotide pyrophosphohydrolase domain-containing protein [Arthrobacter roseus]MBM7847965.1 XTP/dITP diphosphohydrolase [Arthrobacter roseus]